MAINYRKIAECISDEMMPLQQEIVQQKEDKWAALELLYSNGLIQKYISERRRSYLEEHILINGNDS